MTDWQEKRLERVGQDTGIKWTSFFFLTSLKIAGSNIN